MKKEEAIDLLDNLIGMVDDNHDSDYDTAIKMAIKALEQEPKTGHWIRFKEFENGYYHIKCSECGQYWSIDGHAKTFKYCFNCGAKMVEPQESGGNE